MARRFILLMLAASLWKAVLATCHISGHTFRVHETVFIEDNVPPQELAALFDLYNTTGGEDWQWDADTVTLPGIPWNFSVDANPCRDHWQGINCSRTDLLHISEIKLINVGMIGVLPASLSWLTKLTHLLLMNNVLWGPVPEQLGNLSQLTELNLDTNLLEGIIPSSFSGLHSLLVLNLGANRFSGPIPSLNNASDLLELDISSNFFNGSIFESINELAHLELLLVNNNDLSGTIPDSIGNLSNLRRFQANINLLSGTLPVSIGHLSELSQFNIAANLIHGTLPTSIGNWTKVRSLYAQTNMIRGKIPGSVGNMLQLEVLSLQTNKLIGNIPQSLCDITTLTALRLFVNALTGPVPSCLALNYNLTVLVVYENQLTGPLPPVWAAQSKMNYFDVNDNQMTGTIPAAFGSLAGLGSLYLGSNDFHGTVPASLTALPSLVWLYLSYNHLTGSIPSDIGNLDQLLYIEMSGNRLTGTLPDSVGQMSQLQEIHFDTNAFHGPLPDSWAQLTQLLVLNVYRNHLTGPVPSLLGLQTTKLQFIGLDSNRLTGTIPVSLGDCTFLESLQLQDNLLQGTLPVTLKGLLYLTTLLVQSNRLTGPLDGVFDGAAQLALSTVQLSNNMFTGNLPAEAFLAPNLITFAAVSNCFEGSLPATLCTNSALEVLALSGLQAASGCQQRLLPVLSNAYIIKNPLPGGIPDCIYEMKSLKTLQLAGNGLSGSLPAGVVISPTLLDLTLSHNSLTGHIPGQFQERQWETLDLSYNRFAGTLQASLSTRNSSNYTIVYSSAALSLQGNRLSGEIPRSVDPIVNISILSGNLFSCDVLQTNLPPHDSGLSNYECGSTTFEVPYYVWLGVFGVSILIGVLSYRQIAPFSTRARLAQAVEHLRRWYCVLEENKGVNAVQGELDNLRYVFDLYHRVSLLAVLIALFSVLVLFPLYSFMSVYYGTLTHQYAYAVSAAFHSGAVPLGLEMTALLLLLALVLVAFVVSGYRDAARVVGRQKERIDSGASEAALPVYSSLANRVTVYTALLLINVVVVVACNVAYVYVALYESSALLLFAQILLSFYKLAWNKFCASSLIPWTARVLSTSVSNDLMISSVEFFPLQLFLALFNNIAIPCLVVAVVSPNCFSYLLTSAPSVDSQYVVNQCLTFDDVHNVCQTYFAQSESTSFNPPFTYSYQCSASFITYYAPAFVIMCIMSTFGIPALQFAMVWLHKRSSGDGSVKGRHQAVDMLLPNLLKPPFAGEEAEQENLEERWTMVQRDIYSPHFPASQFLLSMLTYMGILLTFGAVFPPLAVALTVTVVGAVVYARLKVGRFLHIAIAEKQYKFLELINKECRGVGSMRMLQAALFLQVTFSCWFFTLFLFDTLGDSVGAESAYWVLIVMPLMPVVFYITFAGLIRLCAPERSLEEGEKNIEMTEAPESGESTIINELHIVDSAL